MLKDKFPTPTVPLKTVSQNRQIFLPDPVVLCKDSVMEVTADGRPLTSKSRCWQQIDPYVIVVEKMTLEMFFPDSLGFQYSSFIHHRFYVTTVMDRI
jgi:hypothetical protein